MALTPASLTDVSRLNVDPPGQRGSNRPQKYMYPRWASFDEFTADTTLLEKVTGFVNRLAFGLFFYGGYRFVTSPGRMFSLALMIPAPRKVVSVALGYLVYPIAIKTSFSKIEKEDLLEEGKEQMKYLMLDDYLVRRIILSKSDIQYDGVVIAHPKVFENGRWSIHALGNGMAYEEVIEELARRNFSRGFNTLLINGPSVVSSKGWPTRYQMGAGFEAGIQFLEKEVEATRIILHGFSLGGAMMGEAIMQHDFSKARDHVRYLSISDRTFSDLSSISSVFANEIVNDFRTNLALMRFSKRKIFMCGVVHPLLWTIQKGLKPAIWATNMELDNMKVARKLSSLGIRHIVIQHSSHNGNGTDGVIPDSVSLLYEMLHHPRSMLPNKVYLSSPEISHMWQLPGKISTQVIEEIDKFAHESPGDIFS